MIVDMLLAPWVSDINSSSMPPECLTTCLLSTPDRTSAVPTVGKKEELAYVRSGLSLSQITWFTRAQYLLHIYSPPKHTL